MTGAPMMLMVAKTSSERVVLEDPLQTADAIYQFGPVCSVRADIPTSARRAQSLVAAFILISEPNSRARAAPAQQHPRKGLQCSARRSAAAYVLA